MELSTNPDDLKGRDLLLLIDPSFSNMGVVIVDPKKFAVQDHKTGEWRETFKWITKTLKEKGKSLRNVIAIVENPDLDKATFDMYGIVKSAFTRKPFNEAEARKAWGIASNYAQKVGKSKSSGKEIIKALASAKVPVIEVAPSKRQTAWENADVVNEITGKKQRVKRRIRDKLKLTLLKSPTKTDDAQYKYLTGYSGRSSEHSRDAGTLGIGINMTWARTTVMLQRKAEGKLPPSFPKTTNDNSFLLKAKNTNPENSAGESTEPPF